MTWRVVLWAGLVVWAAGLFYAWVLCRAADDPDPTDDVEEWPLQWRGKWTVDRHVIDGTDEP